MADSLASFAKRIGLSDSHAKALQSQHGSSWSNDTQPDENLKIACQVAQLILGLDQVETSPVNQTIVKENWSLACVAQPYCVFLPRNSSDVSKILQIIDYFKIKFAVRSGGHSPNPGWSSIDSSGILVSLERLNQVTLSDDKSVASVGPGGRWGDVDATLTPFNVTVLGGRAGPVGVGGLLLGGGYHYLAAEHGLSADNVKNFEIVLADGNITNANATDNSDLFWALKGGGPNFGIVTRYDLYTYPLTATWLQLGIYPIDQAQKTLEAFATWQKDGGSNPKSNVILTITLDAVIIGLTYNEPLSGPPDVFAPFSELTPLQMLIPPSNNTFSIIYEIGNSILPAEHLRHDYRGVASQVDAQLYIDVYNFWREKALDVRNSTGADQAFVLQHVPESLVAQGIAKGGNALNIPQFTHQWWTTLVDWTNAKDDDVVRSVAIDTTAKWKELSAERGLDVAFLYMNDASRDQNPIATYGIDNVNKLKSIAQKYDKSGLFQTQQNGGFLLSKV
ncbi:hypothetical protein PFICI_13511 [Pestalotiopsis fici W106-1]|uniref:FAD-binding PCMH-type domain-containing protein n=1 Tax=Pestalotiopsis fici (strain W106-1 / CGMCC3.15140) TaxID=1229662 RepID=W3WPE7_PESFW|nr:uncharacterized protein PFICI_13511 [Pestalotiopsis fici W106-1]ETS75027.1 hypothetical protein PFICI_13511 [Pestalotiopsis fici W106-1]